MLSFQKPITREVVVEKTREEILEDAFPALQAAARFFGMQPIKRKALQTLPLEKGRIGRANLPEAALRFGMQAIPIRETLKKIEPTRMPLLVMREGKNPVLLLRKRGEGYVFSDSENGNTQFAVFDAFEENEKTLFFHLRPQFFYDHRSALLDLKPYEAWFKGPFIANRKLYIHASLAALFTNLAAVSSSLFIMAVYDRVVPNRALESLAALVIGMGVISIFDLALKTLRAYLIDIAGRRLDINLGSRIFGHLLDLRPNSRPYSAGATANLVREFDSIRDFFTSATMVTLGDLPFIILFLFIIALIAGPVVFVPIAAIILVAGIAFFLRAPMSRLVDEVFRHSSQKSAWLHEVAAGVDVIKSINGQAWARRNYETLLQSSSELNLRLRGLHQFVTNMSALLIGLTTVGVVSFGCLRVISGDMTSGALIAATILSGRALTPLNQIVVLATKWHHVRTAIRALDKMMIQTGESADTFPLINRDAISGTLSFEAVSFNYPPMHAQHKPARKTLSDISLLVKSGEHVAIIGPVGAGKSTLLRLAINLYQPDTGLIQIDDLDIRQLDPADLRRHVGMVGQDNLLFHGTIKENILMGDSWLDDDQLIEIARIAGLGEVLASSEMGLATPVGERGELLSGGQRQAVCIARTLARRPSILLLDEPTSLMDNTTEANFIKRLANYQRKRTLILVTHRASLLQLVERVVVLNKGRIVLDGPRDAVLQKLGRKNPAAAEPSAKTQLAAQ